MFNLTIDPDICVRTLHPDDTDELFALLEKNRSRLHQWIDPSALPATPRSTRIMTIECYFGSLGPIAAMDTPYINEVQPYLPPHHPPMEMGIWFCGSLVGEITLSILDDSATTAEFGYWITVEQEGKGIILRCVKGLMEHAIDNMNIERFVIGCALTNQRSRAVPERLGFHLDATIPQGEVVGEFVYDRTVYGILSTEWRRIKKNI